LGRSSAADHRAAGTPYPYDAEASADRRRHRDDGREDATVHGYEGRREELLTRLRRVEGQVRGLQRMLEEDRYCIDVLTQISSATRALQGVAMSMLDDHVRHCVRDAIDQGPDAADAKVDEALDVIARLVKR
jgi:CsoR family transcriptional regulator, copper-sensing transcriptional repressor